MTDSLIAENESKANSICRSVYAKDVTQVCKSTGLEPIELVHSFYGISPDNQVFNLASITVSETAIDSRIGQINMGIYNSSGTFTNVLSLDPYGALINGNINITGGETVFQTNSVSVLDKKVILANTATLLSHLDGGGIVLGTPESTEKTILYNSSSGTWDFNTSIRIPTGCSFSIGTGTSPLAVFNQTSVTIGGVSLSGGNLILSDTISLTPDGLIIGSVSIQPSTGITIGSNIIINTDGFSLNGSTANPVFITPQHIQLGSVDPVVIDSGGISLGSDLSLTLQDGLLISDTVSVSESGLRLGILNAADTVTLSQDGLFCGTSFSITPQDGLNIQDVVTINDSGLTLGVSPDQVLLNTSGLIIGSQISLSVEDGLEVGETITINDTVGISIGTEPSQVLINTSGISIASLSLTVLDGLTFPGISLNADGLVINDIEINSSGITLSDTLSLTTEDGLSIGTIQLNESGFIIGSDISLTIDLGLQIADTVSLTEAGLSLGTTNPTILNSSTLSIGTTIQLTESSGLTLSSLNGSKITLGNGSSQSVYTGTQVSLAGGETTLNTSLTLPSQIIIGSLGTTILDSTSLRFLDGTSVLDKDSLTTNTLTVGDLSIESSGLHLQNKSIFLGDDDNWKIYYNPQTQNLIFSFYDSITDTYITKLELRNAN